MSNSAKNKGNLLSVLSKPWTWLAFIAALVILAIAVHLIATSKVAVITDESFWKSSPNLPVLRVDQEHSQMDVKQAKVYELTPVRGVTIDFAGYKLRQIDKLANEKMTIQVVPEPNFIYTHPIVAGQFRYSICPLGGFTSGQDVVIGMGYEKTTGRKIDFSPVWAGIVKVK